MSKSCLKVGNKVVTLSYYRGPKNDPNSKLTLPLHTNTSYVLKQLYLRPKNKKGATITILFSNWELGVIGKIEYIVALFSFYANTKAF